MSLFLDWVTNIEAQANEAWLTKSQQDAYDMIIERWSNAPFVCLCGLPGSGKTFVARLLVQHHGYHYTHNLEEVKAGSKQVIVDNAEYSRMMRSTATVLGLQRVIIICQQPPIDPMPHAKICLTDRDVAQFRQNITRNGVLSSFLTHIETTNLDLILRTEAIGRGVPHVNR